MLLVKQARSKDNGVRHVCFTLVYFGLFLCLNSKNKETLSNKCLPAGDNKKIGMKRREPWILIRQRKIY